MKVQIPHFAFPFQLDRNGAVEVVEQDTYEEIEQNVHVLLITDRGQRMEVPDFGIDDLVFQTAVDETDIIEQAREWDDRVEALVSEEPDRMNAMVRHLLVDVSEAED